MRLRGGAAEEEIKIEFPSFVKDKSDFNHVVRIFNTNMDGSRTVLFGLIGIKGIGRRFGDAVIKRSGIDGTKRIGELTAEEVEKLVQVMEKPLDYDIPVWMLNRRKDYVTGKDLHNHTNKWDFQVKTDIERLVKMRAHRGLRHAWGYKVAPFPPASCMSADG
jgi:small subunit ribosomal protein S18e